MAANASPRPGWALRHTVRDRGVGAPVVEISNGEFIRILRTLPASAPVADAYEKFHGQKRGVWYQTQQKHMIGWFKGQATRGFGAYIRTTPNCDARLTYNRLQCGEALLWIGEALGADHSLVSVATEAAVAETGHRRRCGIIRHHLSWAAVVAPLVLDRLKSL